MDNDWQIVKEAAHRIVAAPATERSSILSDACLNHEHLRNHIIRLVGIHLKAGDFLEQPVELPEALLDHLEEIEQLPTIEGFTIRRRIGEGGMGVVYLAWQTQLSRQVAIKMLRPSLFRDDLHKRFEREIRILARIEHHHIARIYDVGRAGRQQIPYIVMEYVDGVCLTDLASRPDVDTRDRLRLIEKVARAIHYVHQQGIIHRDLKPANILVDQDGEPRILDFGVAKLTTHNDQQTSLNTQTGQIIGTLAYMSPEQVAGDANRIDIRCDIYALGVMLYELLTGRLPYELSEPSLLQAISIIGREDPVPLGQIHPSFQGNLEYIVAKALHKDPQQRYASAEDLADDTARHLRSNRILLRLLIYRLGRLAAKCTRLLLYLIILVGLIVAGMAQYQWIQKRNQAAGVPIVAGEAAAAEQTNDALEIERLRQQYQQQQQQHVEQMQEQHRRHVQELERLQRLHHQQEQEKEQVSHLYQQRERELAQLREEHRRQQQQWEHDRQQQRERERQARLAHDHRMAHLLSTARQHASQKDGYAALAALDDLLGNEPSHPEALALRESVIRHHGPIDRFDLSRSRSAGEMVSLQQGWADHFGVPVEFSNSIGMRLRLVPPGVMPSPRRESNIRLTQGFYMAATPVTQEQYLSIMGNNPSHFWEPKRPVEMVSWHRATEFCRLLTERERASGRIAFDQQYQLATETQWEYACRAGTATDYHVGQLSSELSSVAWFSDNSNQQTHPVGLKLPNALVLHDMHGNVWEWCSDWYKESLPDQAIDPIGPAAGTLRVVRGGAWNVIPSYCRSDHRLGLDPDSRENHIGFRVILTPLRSP